MSLKKNISKIVILLFLVSFVSCSKQVKKDSKKSEVKKDTEKKIKEVKEVKLTQQEKNRIVIQIDTELQLHKNLKEIIILAFEEIATSNNYSIIDQKTKEKAFVEIKRAQEWEQNDPRFLQELKKQLSANKIVQIKITKQDNGDLLLTNRLISLETSMNLKTASNLYTPTTDNNYEKLFDEIQLLAKKFLSKSVLKTVFLDVSTDLDITNLVIEKLTKNNYIVTENQVDSNQVLKITGSINDKISITLNKKYPYGGTFYSKTVTCKEKSICVDLLFAEDFKQQIITNRWGMEFVEIPKGSFMMNRNDNDYLAKSQDSFKLENIRNNFYIATTETTQEVWERIMGVNPSKNRGKRKPVDNISFENVELFLSKINKLDKKYKYRLPSEAEWEYAARAGSTNKYFWDNTSASVDQYAWHFGNSARTSHQVGEKLPNRWGLYDVSGNLFEMTSSHRKMKLISYKIVQVIKGGSYLNKDLTIFNLSTFMTMSKLKRAPQVIGFRLIVEKK